MRNHTFALAIALPVLGITFAGGCQSSTPASEPPAPAERPTAANPLFGEWTLDQINGKSVAPMLLPGGRVPSLAVSPDGKVSGSGGVNRLSGATDPAGLAGGRVDLSKLAVTRMAGAPMAMKLERLYLSALGKATGYGFDKSGALELRDGAGTLLRFVPAGK